MASVHTTRVYSSSPRPIPHNAQLISSSSSRPIVHKVNLAEEEDASDYRPGGYHPVHIMDTFSNGRYLVLRKMGWGHFSTVWLAKDNHLNRHVALKIMKSSRRYTETANDEIKLLRIVQTANTSHPGHSHLVSFLDSFEHPGLHDLPHVCMTFEPLGENLLSLTQRCVRENKLAAAALARRRLGSHTPPQPQSHLDLAVPLRIVKAITRQILLGLAYLHEECKLIHTDLKPENILISLPDVEEVVRMELLAIPTSESIKASMKTVIGVPAGFNRTKSPSSLHNNQVYIFSSQPLSSPSRTPISSLQNSPMERLGMRMSAMNINARAGSATTATAAVTAMASKTSPSGSTEKSAYQLASSVVTTSPPALSDDSPPSSSPSSQSTTPITPPSEDSSLAGAPSYHLESPMGSYKITGLASSVGSMDVVVVPRIFKSVDGSVSKREVSNDGTETVVNGNFAREKTPVSISGLTPLSSGSTPTSGPTPRANSTAAHTSSPTPPTLNVPSGPSLLSRTAPKPAGPSGLTSTLQHDKILPTVENGLLPPLPAMEIVPDSLPPIHIKIADMGNATPIHKKFTNDIQTRQYRSPEAILGMYEWDEKVDVFSVACLVFELLTGEYLFNPKSRTQFSKDDDHVAQMIELMGDGFTQTMKTAGKYSRELFRSNGSLRNIQRLHYWPIAAVMVDKYDYSQEDAERFASFMEPMLAIDPAKRASASSLVDHEWLNI